MEKAKRLFTKLMCRMSFIKPVVIAILMIITIFMLGCKEPDAVSEADYKAMCKEIPVVELTNNPKDYIGQKIKITGEVIVMEEAKDQESGERKTLLVLGVNDPSSTSSSKKLPVFISYVGSTSAFIYDIVDVYGNFYGTDTPDLKAIEKKTLPRINARFILIEPIKKDNK